MIKRVLKKKNLGHSIFDRTQKYEQRAAAEAITSYPLIEKPAFKFLYTNEESLKQRITFLLTIKVLANNVFCSFKNLQLNKTVFIYSAGLLRLKMTKRKLKTTPKLIIDMFLTRVESELKQTELLLVDITAPMLIKEYILESVFSGSIKQNNLIINIKDKKSFNGCRPRKRRRGKRSSEAGFSDK
jgi:hypothetical protein